MMKHTGEGSALAWNPGQKSPEAENRSRSGPKNVLMSSIKTWQSNKKKKHQLTSKQKQFVWTLILSFNLCWIGVFGLLGGSAKVCDMRVFPGWRIFFFICPGGLSGGYSRTGMKRGKVFHCPVKRFSHQPPPPPRSLRTPWGGGGAYEIRNTVFIHPLGVYKVWFQLLPLVMVSRQLWWLTRLQFWQWSPTVKTYGWWWHFTVGDDTFYSQWQNLQSLSCVSLYKFCHQL